MDRPFRMQAAFTCELVSVHVDQHEVGGTLDLAEAETVPLQSEASSQRITQGKMPERKIAVAFHLEFPAGARQSLERLVRAIFHSVLPQKWVFSTTLRNSGNREPTELIRSVIRRCRSLPGMKSISRLVLTPSSMTSGSVKTSARMARR